MRYSHAGSCWWSLAIQSRIMWCAFFSRQSRYSNATHALTNARQSFWIMRVHQSPAFSIIFNIFPCVKRSLTVIAKVWQSEPRSDLAIMLSHLPNNIDHLRNYEHSMGSLEHKGLIYLRHNRFWTKNRASGSDEYEAFWYIPDELGIWKSENMKSGMPLREFRKIILYPMIITNNLCT